MRKFFLFVAGILIGVSGLQFAANIVIGKNLDQGLIYHEIGGKYAQGKIQEARDFAEQMNLPETLAAIDQGELTASSLRQLAREENSRKLWRQWFWFGMPCLGAGIVIVLILAVTTRRS